VLLRLSRNNQSYSTPRGTPGQYRERKKWSEFLSIDYTATIIATASQSDERVLGITKFSEARTPHESKQSQNVPPCYSVAGYRLFAGRILHSDETPVGAREMLIVLCDMHLRRAGVSLTPRPAGAGSIIREKQAKICDSCKAVILCVSWACTVLPLYLQYSRLIYRSVVVYLSKYCERCEFPSYRF